MLEIYYFDNDFYKILVYRYNGKNLFMYGMFFYFDIDNRMNS